MKLYHGWLSSASRRVRLCLAEKGLAYESIPIDMGKQEHHSPAYLAMNPNGVVPALLLDNGASLYESSTICEYLDDVHPQPPLRPADAFDRAVMRNFVRWTDEKSLPHLLVLNWSIALQPGASQWSDAQLKERLARIPTPERREAWTRIARQPYTDEEKAVALEKLLALLGKMEAMLADSGDWLVGGAYSLADIAAVPFVARIAELAPDALSHDRCPRTAGWWARVQQRPAFALARFDRFDAALRQRDAAAALSPAPARAGS
ncbi:glutathione S-transferase [Variovorax boronicumulans]|uniref:Glutathione S-transferase n=1 Tax=Variovorax boronicumulans TaxID=436515 RepID=A0AAW8D3X1_9BURK|nr:glutathione S-transferase family protein [Variovorax boronicumulans]MDP9895448.1 glutathione S-transferase [Variovorax boronicumulans]MDQ0055488.1 glutathione S-transferase [Variovorax boronicumulans]